MANPSLSTFAVIKKSASEFSEDECSTLAAAIAYYTAFSLPPLLVLIVTIAGWMWRPEAVTGEIEQQMTSVVGEGGWQQAKQMMEAAGNQSGGRLAALLGIVALVFGATGVMVQLQAALNKAWEVQPDPDVGGLKNFIMKRVLSLAMIITVAFLLMMSVVLTAVLATATDLMAQWLPAGVAGWVPLTVDFAVSLAVFTLAFAAMFKWLPDADLRWRDTWVGALATGLLFMAGKFALGLYFSQTGAGTYGAAGSFVLILLWVYYSSMILLFGAEFTQVWARQRGGGVRPAKGAVRVVRELKTIRGNDENRPNAAATKSHTVAGH